MNPTTTFFDRVRQQIAEDPDRPLYAFANNDGEETGRLSYLELCQEASRVARFLLDDLGLQPTQDGKPGDRVLLVYPPGLDFVVAFVGCLFAGLLPVPLPPPNPFRLRHSLDEFESVAQGSDSRLVLTNGEYLRGRRLAAAKNLLTGRATAWHRLPWKRTDNLPRNDVDFRWPDARPEDTAFLQYTSGSTSAPKGVMITHRNIVHQLAINASELSIDARSRAVLWVPHFHDFCLVSGILSALFGNGLLMMLSPLSFLRRPAVWFEVMSRLQATHTAAPDFAYRLALRKTTPEQREGWDLSHLKVVMSAAEPIRPSTVDGFLEAFSASGLPPQAFCPAYGLAEHTVGVSVAGRGRLVVDRHRLEGEGVAVAAQDSSNGEGVETLTLVGCGPPSEGVTVRIVDPESGAVRGEGEVGEIWVDSPSKAEGYWALPELSDELFRAGLEDQEFLRTGDLGFLHGGELFVTGRLKDLIIVRGRNIYPQDLEETAASAHGRIRPGRVVAFGGLDLGDQEGGEKVVVVVEVDSEKLPAEERAEVAKAVRRLLKGEHQVSCDEILIVRPGEVLKTTSGKLRRRACRQAWEEGGLRQRALLVDTID